MRAKRAIVIIENKKGDLYQVAMTGEQQQAVMALLVQLHAGGIKVLREKLPLEIRKPEIDK